MEKSELSFFHNQKEGGFDHKTKTLHTPGSKKHLKHEEYKKGIESGKEIGFESELESQVKKVIETIKKIEIEGSYKSSQEQINLLERKKQQALNKIRTVLLRIDDYMNSIKKWDDIRTKKEGLDQNHFINEFKNADKYRKQVHNSLITETHAAIKFISHNFGNIDERAIEEWEEGQIEKGIDILYSKRQDFPPNIICPDNINIRDREQIAKWAFQLWHAIKKDKGLLLKKAESLDSVEVA